MKKYLFGLLLWLALPARAEQLQFDLTGVGYLGTPFDFSFTLDSLAGSPIFHFGNGCLADARVPSVTFGSMSLVENGRTLKMGDVNGSYSLYRPALDCPGNLLYTFASAVGSTEFAWNVDPPGTSETAVKTSSDPMGLVLSHFNDSNEASYLWVNTPGESTNLSVNHVSVAPVPEPATLGLFVGAAILIIWYRRRARAS